MALEVLALGTSKQAAWEAHSRWIDDQERRHQENPDTGLNEQEVAGLRDRLS